MFARRCNRSSRSCVHGSFLFFLLTMVVTVGCRKSERKPMTDSLPTWKRDHYQPSDGRALIVYAVYGEFTNKVTISQSEYRTAGIPQGFVLRKVDRKKSGALPFTDEEFGKGVHDKVLLDRIRQAPECM